MFDEYGIGHSKGSAAAFHMTRMHHPLGGAGPHEIMDYPTLSRGNYMKLIKTEEVLTGKVILQLNQ